MSARRCVATGMLCLLLCSFLALPPSQSLAQSRQIIGYYPSWKWNSRNNLVSPARIPYEKLTIINYAFFAPRPDGSIVGKDTVGDALYLSVEGKVRSQGRMPGVSLQARAHEHGVKLMLSLGGWEDSDNFPAVAAQAETRAAFARSCVEFIRTYDFDGIDIDWEYPGYVDHKGTPEDTRNFTELLRALRDSLTAYGQRTGRRYLLTAAIPTAPSVVANMEVRKVAEILDYLNVMTYDFNGPWEPRSGHNAPLYPVPGEDSVRCVDGAFRLFTETYGVPAAKINLGVPFYGQTYTACTQLRAPHKGADTVHFSTFGAFYYDIYRQLDRFTRVWDDTAKAPYLVSKEWNMLVSYDDERSIGMKAQYARDRGAAGLIIWEITGDYLPDGTTPLLDAVSAILQGPALIRPMERR